jgi:hypothetical protein
MHLFNWSLFDLFDKNLRFISCKENLNSYGQELQACDKHDSVVVFN